MCENGQRLASAKVMNLRSGIGHFTKLVLIGLLGTYASPSSAQLLIDDPDSPHPEYVRAYIESEDSGEDDLQAYKLIPPPLIAEDGPPKTGVFKLKFDGSLQTATEATPKKPRASLGVPSMEAKILAVPLYSNVYFSDEPSRVFLSAGGGALSIGAAGGGYEFNGRSGLLVRFSAHASYSNRFYPIAGMRLGRSF